MPRLTDPAYLKQRRALVEDWQRGGHSFILLDYMDQLTLHEYYRPAEQLTDHEALTHRRRAGHESPSLPREPARSMRYCSERSLMKRRDDNTLCLAAPVRRVGRKRIYNIRVRGLARPTPDYDKLARALLEHARNEAEKADSSNQGADAP
ncbi:hypothetical protein IFU08_12295 [Microbacterium sp. CFBP 8790]|uniref:hypothetical protein n=1 Tax=unclassified Microbacterium TaxID=2609290 RepID=UPI00177DAD0D|nr:MULTISPECIES: hypothetical protein [unclassified Microbacterium]MBD8206701.1 hypothetical protein [Microbacterium sp. CFBP 8801]MBD8510337.1 hypothetical protein [Microbacterium sp. CFBP 8790]